MMRLVPAARQFRPAPAGAENSFGRHDDERRVVLETAIGERVDRLGEAGLKRGRAARAVGHRQVDEPLVAELVVGALQASVMPSV